MTTVTQGFHIPSWLAVTAYPFAVGSQNGTEGVRPWAWDDLLHKPIMLLPVVIMPILVVGFVMKRG